MGAEIMATVTSPITSLPIVWRIHNQVIFETILGVGFPPVTPELCIWNTSVGMQPRFMNSVIGNSCGLVPTGFHPTQCPKTLNQCYTTCGSFMNEMYLMVHGKRCPRCGILTQPGNPPPPGTSPAWTGAGTGDCFASSICQTDSFTKSQLSANCPTPAVQGWTMATSGITPFFLATSRNYPCVP